MQAGEKEKEDNMVDALGPHEIATMENAELHSLRRQLAERHAGKNMDGYGYYLYVTILHLLVMIGCWITYAFTFSYGVVLKNLSNEEEARKMLLHSLSLTPMLWSSWHELAKLCKDREMVYLMHLD